MYSPQANRIRQRNSHNHSYASSPTRGTMPLAVTTGSTNPINSSNGANDASNEVKRFLHLAYNDCVSPDLMSPYRHLNINTVTDLLGCTVLHIAAMKGNIKCLNAALGVFGPMVNLDVVNGRGHTPLHLAASYGRTKITKLLLQLGANPVHTDHRGNTALDIVEHGNQKLMRPTERQKMLLVLKEYTNRHHLSSGAVFTRPQVISAIQAYDVDTIEKYLRYGGDPSARLPAHQCKTFLHLIGETFINFPQFDRDRLKILNMFLNAGADVDAVDVTGVSVMDAFLAKVHGKPWMRHSMIPIVMLLQHNCHVDKRTIMTKLEAGLPNTQEVLYMMKRYYENQCTVPMDITGLKETLDSLKSGSDSKTSRSSGGSSANLRAAAAADSRHSHSSSGSHRSADEANPAAQLDLSHLTSREGAASAGHFMGPRMDTDDFLQAAEDDNFDAIDRFAAQRPMAVNRQGEEGWTALHSACMTGNATTVVHLMSLGAYPMMQSDNGSTCFHIAASFGKFAAVDAMIATLRPLCCNDRITKVMIRDGLTAKNKKGLTAYDVAVKRKYGKIAAAITEFDEWLSVSADYTTQVQQHQAMQQLNSPAPDAHVMPPPPARSSNMDTNAPRRRNLGNNLPPLHPPGSPIGGMSSMFASPTAGEQAPNAPIMHLDNGSPIFNDSSNQFNNTTDSGHLGLTDTTGGLPLPNFLLTTTDVNESPQLPSLVSPTAGYLGGGGGGNAENLRGTLLLSGSGSDAEQHHYHTTTTLLRSRSPFRSPPQNVGNDNGPTSRCASPSVDNTNDDPHGITYELCVACLEMPASILFKCGHQVLCPTCNKKLAKRVCPMCRSKV